MKMNRVQFQSGLSMPEFLERCGTEAKCRVAPEAARWPDGFVCPSRGGSARTRYERGGLPYWQRGGCAYQLAPRTSVSWLLGSPQRELAS